MRRQEERRVPVEAQREVDGVGLLLGLQRVDLGRDFLAGRLQRVTSHDGDGVFPLPELRLPRRLAERRALARAHVHARHVAALRLAVGDVRVDRVLRGVKTVAAGNGVPVRQVDRPALAAARAAPRAIVLRAGADVVRDRHVVTDFVELGDRQVLHLHVVAALVERDGDAAVIGEGKALRVVRVDPQPVIVHVHVLRRDARRLAAVIRHHQLRRGEVDAVGVPGVDAHLRVIEGAHVGVVGLHPGLAGIGGAVETVVGGHALGDDLAVLRRLAGFHHRVHDVGVARRDGQTDASLGPGRKAVAGDLGPRLAGVERLPEPGTRTAALERIRGAQALVGGGVHHVRVARIERDVHEAGLVADELHQLPRRAAVGGLVEAAFGLLDHAAPSAATQTTFGLRGSTATRPMCCVFSSPISFQVMPPSADL